MLNVRKNLSNIFLTFVNFTNKVFSAWENQKFWEHLQLTSYKTPSLLFTSERKNLVLQVKRRRKTLKYSQMEKLGTNVLSRQTCKRTHQNFLYFLNKSEGEKCFALFYLVCFISFMLQKIVPYFFSCVFHKREKKFFFLPFTYCRQSGQHQTDEETNIFILFSFLVFFWSEKNTLIDRTHTNNVSAFKTCICQKT